MLIKILFTNDLQHKSSVYLLNLKTKKITFKYTCFFFFYFFAPNYNDIISQSPPPPHFFCNFDCPLLLREVFQIPAVGMIRTISSKEKKKMFSTQCFIRCALRTSQRENFLAYVDYQNDWICIRIQNPLIDIRHLHNNMYDIHPFWEEQPFCILYGW